MVCFDGIRFSRSTRPHSSSSLLHCSLCFHDCQSESLHDTLLLAVELVFTPTRVMEVQVKPCSLDLANLLHVNAALQVYSIEVTQKGGVLIQQKAPPFPATGPALSFFLE